LQRWHWPIRMVVRDLHLCLTRACQSFWKFACRTSFCTAYIENALQPFGWTQGEGDLFPVITGFDNDEERILANSIYCSCCVVFPARCLFWTPLCLCSRANCEKVRLPTTHWWVPLTVLNVPQKSSWKPPSPRNMPENLTERHHQWPPTKRTQEGRKQSLMKQARNLSRDQCTTIYAHLINNNIFRIDLVTFC
jgi:hypothetical protein